MFWLQTSSQSEVTCKCCRCLDYRSPSYLWYTNTGKKWQCDLMQLLVDIRQQCLMPAAGILDLFPAQEMVTPVIGSISPSAGSEEFRTAIPRWHVKSPVTLQPSTRCAQIARGRLDNGWHWWLARCRVQAQSGPSASAEQTHTSTIVHLVNVQFCKPWQVLSAWTCRLQVSHKSTPMGCIPEIKSTQRFFRKNNKQIRLLAEFSWQWLGRKKCPNDWTVQKINLDKSIPLSFTSAQRNIH